MLEKEEKYDFFEITNFKHPALYAPESPVWDGPSIQALEATLRRLVVVIILFTEVATFHNIPPFNDGRCWPWLGRAVRDGEMSQVCTLATSRVRYWRPS